MPTSLPKSVRETWGEQVADDFAHWFAENVQYELVTKDEYREILSRLDVLEKRFDLVEEQFDHVEEQFDHVGERFDEVNGRLDRMEERFENRFEQVDERFESMEERFDKRFEGMEERFDKRLEGIDVKLDRMNDRILSMTRWLIGLIALFGSLVTALLAVAQFGG